MVLSVRKAIQMDSARIHRVQDAYDPALWVFREKAETKLYHRDEPQPGIFIAESFNVISRALDAGYEAETFLVEEERLEEAAPLLSRAPGAAVYVCPHSALQEITGYPMMRGFLCAMKRKALPAASDICRGAGRIAIREDVENPTNVGAIFRSAAAMFVDALLLTGSCSDPLYRRAIRVSMGCVFQIPWTVLPKGALPKVLAELSKEGVLTCALALTDHSVSIGDGRLKNAQRLALVLGNEGYGLTEETIKACDLTVKIPMAHGVDSLNVAAASAVAFWETKKRGGEDK